MVQVEVTNVQVERAGHPVLAPTTFSVDRGRVLAVTGANGSGKTTLLRVLAGLERASAGRCLVAGRPIDERDPRFRRAVAALVGPPPTARDLTVLEHLELVARTWGSDAATAGRTADRLLGELGIARLAQRLPHQLSAGQAHLCALALTLARPGEVLLLDEPEQRLDEDRLTAVSQLLDRRRRDGATLLLATHSSRLVEELDADELVLREAA
ncbi:ABC transporter ATP-binding protein [Ornithinimicrobium pratense]|uniref:ABC transporter ATP-binding protein n=1 Tax=Ornithinimicrobium pratense TaxID=2593973 RepID=A0A5J6V8D4_9MICO|nr:ATP-binding cassette domain-containing protein [Ornithinimicrobium pratense]QFG69386.1 ABC transporter ATP-binding protein [Ornithinimicrobium pratense]